MKTILDLYAKMVSKGEWKDYGLTIGPKEISFDIYQKVRIDLYLKYRKILTLETKMKPIFLKIEMDLSLKDLRI